MNVSHTTPILNVSDILASFAWFEPLAWKKKWSWGEPPTFGCVATEKAEIFLCQGAQGSRGGSKPSHVGDDDRGGVWMSWWLESPKAVDEAHALAVKLGYMITWPPTNEPWNVREFHLVHPDGHTFRVSAGIDCE